MRISISIVFLYCISYVTNLASFNKLTHLLTKSTTLLESTELGRLQCIAVRI